MSLEKRLEADFKARGHGSIYISLRVKSWNMISARNPWNRQRVFARYCPQIQFYALISSTWLLDPNLVHILPEESNIIKFMRMFSKFLFAEKFQ